MASVALQRSLSYISSIAPTWLRLFNPDVHCYCSRRPARSLHAMDLGISGPLPECLSIEPEDDSGTTEEGDQGHVCHDGWDVSGLDDPGRDELRKSISPNILVDRDGNKDGTGDGLVGIDRVS